MTDERYFGQRGVDHYYTSYRFYKRAIGDPTCIKDDQDPPSLWDIEFDKGIDGHCPPTNTTSDGGCDPLSAYVGGTIVHVTPASNVLWGEEWNVHQPTLSFYGRNTAYRDGHAKWMPANEYLVQ